MSLGTQFGRQRWVPGGVVLAVLLAAIAVGQDDEAQKPLPKGTKKPAAAPAVPREPAPKAPAPVFPGVMVGAGNVKQEEAKPLDAVEVWAGLVDEMRTFGQWQGYAHMLVTALLSVLLAAAIAYHPRSYGKAATLEEVEQPKIFLVYGLVGAVVGQICRVHSGFGLVIFGLGGLFRFRTDVGPARDTGRLILVTLVGIFCGYGMLLPAVLATVIAWLLIYSLESRIAHKLTVKGLDEASLAEAAEAHSITLTENGCAVLSQKKNFLKKQVSFVFRAPKDFDREALEVLFKDLPPKLQGAADWESS